MAQTKIIAITGGIGAGKSIVSAILRVAGYDVYDCDQRAKMLMNTSATIKNSLTHKFGHDIYTSEGNLNRTRLSDIIFNDHDALHYVNSIVHPAVRDDISHWAQEHQHGPLFVETAILKEGGLDTIVQEAWNVVAPVEVRISRVMKRNAISREKVLERINNQQQLSPIPGKKVVDLINDGTTPILPQIISALQ